MATITYARALREALAEELERDDRVFVMGQDVGAHGGVFRVTRGLQEQFGPERVFDTPISETFIVGGGVGAAITGLRPVVELQYADFIQIAMDEIYSKAAKWRYMHGGLFDVPLVIRAPEGAVGGAGPEHSMCPEALLWSASGLHVLTPSTPADAKGLLKAAIRSNDPVVFFEHKALYGMKGHVPDGEHVVPIGRADVKRRGTDVTVVAWSRLVHGALEAAERLESDGISVEVVDPRGLRPLDVDTIVASVRKTGRLIVAHEAPRPGGPGSEVAAIIAEQAIEHLIAPVKRVAAPDVPIPQSDRLERMVIPKADDVVEAIKSIF